MRLIAILLALLLVSPAFSEPQTLDQRIGGRIGTLVLQNEALQMQVEQLQAALKATQDHVKALEEKYEPKSAPTK